MSEIILSKIKPITHESNNFLDTFEQLLTKSDGLRIAVAYTSIESTLALQYYIQNTKINNCELIIGMCAFAGVTQSQYDSLYAFNNFLKDKKSGSVYVLTAFPYHGKLYLFDKTNNCLGGIMGSSNLSALQGLRQFEIDHLITPGKDLNNLDQLYSNFKTTATKHFSDWDPKIISSGDNLPLYDCPGVQKIDPPALVKIRSKIGHTAIEIPLKTEPKSNLNAFFGKGRENMRTHVIRPRPWYEVELIVPKEITGRKEYPRKEDEIGRIISVITDDGWQFKCKISGDYSKNFRSCDDLKTLGLWIKGRMELSGALKPGQMVTDQTLKLYGRNTVTLSNTDDKDVWFLDFGVYK